MLAKLNPAQLEYQVIRKLFDAAAVITSWKVIDRYTTKFTKMKIVKTAVISGSIAKGQSAILFSEKDR